MELTGNPFVDVGLSIAAQKIGRASVKALSTDDLWKTVGILHGSVDSVR